MTKIQYSEEELLADLISLAEILGYTPQESDINKASKEGKNASLGPYQRNFGSLTNALVRAGLPLHRVFRTDEELLDDVIALAEKLDITPTARDISAASKRGECASLETYRRRLGKHNDVLRKAGLPVNKHGVSVKQTTKKDLIRDLKLLAQELGRTPRAKEVSACCSAGKCSSVPTYVDWFGSFNNALQAAGLVPIRIIRTNEELLNDLRKLNKQLGRTPKRQDISKGNKKEECAGLQVYYYRFGSFSKAVELAGLRPN